MRPASVIPVPTSCVSVIRQILGTTGGSAAGAVSVFAAGGVAVMASGSIVAGGGSAAGGSGGSVGFCVGRQ